MKASEYIKQGWCQGAAARDKDGKEVDAFSPEAVCFCALGAVSRAYVDKHGLMKQAQTLLSRMQTDRESFGPKWKQATHEFQELLKPCLTREWGRVVRKLKEQKKITKFDIGTNWNDDPQRTQADVVALLESLKL